MTKAEADTLLASSLCIKQGKIFESDRPVTSVDWEQEIHPCYIMS